MKKSKYYWELLAAVGGDVAAWHNLGIKEENAGNINLHARGDGWM